MSTSAYRNRPLPIPPPPPFPSMQKVRTFVKNEDQNFSLFNYVNEQQNEVEKLEEQLHQLQEEEQKFAQVCHAVVCYFVL